ncbi:MAG: alpha-2-macroglobulin, partial [Bacteroidales bacterium]|nr:alpha-2-macroglobulin [Bacteroidales bacterium]
ISPEMAPNVYVSITLVQPHAQSKNDAPIRLYGTIPIMVEDPDSRITPVLEMADVLEPEKKVEISVYEKNGMPMTYTIAMVDEGLLDLTRFRTPDPWRHFFAREALGIKTWDLYSYVIGAYGGKLEKVFGIGGGDEISPVKDLKANRFKPVVKFLGPFDLDKGETAEHAFTMPNYVGSVRTMVVAAGYMSYGSNEKTTAVKKPLMLLATLPRVLGPSESVALPVTVFAMDEDIRSVTLNVKANKMFTLNSFQKQITFEAVGDHVINFELETIKNTGIGKVEIEAVSGQHRATYIIDIDIRNPNPPVTQVFSKKLDPGASYTLEHLLPGMQGGNTAVLEVSSLLPIDLDRRLNYLIRYPHGCLEQTISGAFPQLYIPALIETTDAMNKRITAHIRSALNKLIRFQTSDGSLTLWPGGRSSDWVSSYAGHFFLEAEKQGYALPVGLKSSWLAYQQERAGDWSPDEDSKYNKGLAQAYRLYTLALAGHTDLRAMNRLRETPGLCVTGTWKLVAAYVLAGQPEAARQIGAGSGFNVSEYSAFDQTYGSALRDKAMILQSLCLMDERDQAFPIAQEISRSLTGRGWMSTQTTSFCLMAMSAFYGESHSTSIGMRYSYSVNSNDPEEFNTDHYLMQTVLDPADKEKITLEFFNEDDKDLYFTLAVSGCPLVDSTNDVDNNIKMQVFYRDLEGNAIDPARIEQGTDFLAEVKISNAGLYNSYRDLALTQIFPSGWEIINKRMYNVPDVISENTYEYRDIRDDRVITYFSLYRRGTVKYTVLLNASYTGRFYMPGPQCEAMYNHDVYARRSGKWIEVVKAE